jgi:hypothetical protein
MWLRAGRGASCTESKDDDENVGERFYWRLRDVVNTKVRPRAALFAI